MYFSISFLPSSLFLITVYFSIFLSNTNSFVSALFPITSLQTAKGSEAEVRLPSCAQDGYHVIIFSNQIKSNQIKNYLWSLREEGLGAQVRRALTWVFPEAFELSHPLALLFLGLHAPGCHESSLVKSQLVFFNDFKCDLE